MQATLLGEKSRTVHPQIAQQCVEVEKHRLGGQRQWTIDDPTILYLVLPTNKRKLRRVRKILGARDVFGIRVQIEIDSRGKLVESQTVPTCCQGDKCAVTFSKFFDRAADHPLVDKSGEYNPDQVSFVRARNVNGKCGAKNK